MKLIDKLIQIIFGKRIVILGHNCSGKTTLQNFLREGQLNNRYELTSDLVRLKSCSYKNGSTKFHLKKGIDLNGDKIYTKYWETLIKDSDYSVFVFDTYKVLNNDQETIHYISEHLPFASKLAKKYKQKLIVFGNFTDKIYNFDINRLEIKNRLRPNLANALDEAGMRFNSVVFGSMNTKEDIRKSLDIIYSEISKHKKKKRIRNMIIVLFVILILTILFAVVYYKQRYAGSTPV